MWTGTDRETYRDEGRRYPSDLTDGYWATITPLLSGCDALTADLREMVNACLHLEKTSCPLALPADRLRAVGDGAHVARSLRADGLWSAVAGRLTRGAAEARARAVHGPPRCAERGVRTVSVTDGGKTIRGITRHVLTSLVTAAAEGAIDTANCHRLIRADHRSENGTP